MRVGTAIPIVKRRITIFPDLDFEVFHGASSPMKLFEVVKRVKEICVIAERLSFT